MAKYAGKSTAVYIAGADLSGDLNSVDTDRTADTLDTTGFGNSAKTRIGGLLDGKVSWKGFFNDATTTGLDTVLAPLVGSPAVSSFYPGGDAAGAHGKAGSAELLKDYKVSAPVAGVVTVQADFDASGGLDPVTSILPKTTLAGTGSAQVSTAVDNGAASTNGGRAYFHILAEDAATTVSPLKVQHSADNSTFVDLASSGQAGTAPGGDSVVISGTINRYVRSSATITNTKNATLQCALCRF